jgi:hypothetical protein
MIGVVPPLRTNFNKTTTLNSIMCLEFFLSSCCDGPKGLDSDIVNLKQILWTNEEGRKQGRKEARREVTNAILEISHPSLSLSIPWFSRHPKSTLSLVSSSSLKLEVCEVKSVAFSSLHTTSKMDEG